MEDEDLKELNAIFESAISSSMSSAKRMSLGGDPRDALLDMFQVQIDNTKVDIGRLVEKLDIDTSNLRPGNVSLEQILYGPKEINVDMADYVRETKNGIEVFDGSQWFLFSKESEIDFQVNTDPEVNNNSPLVRVSAYDSVTGFRISYIDYDTDTIGDELSFAGSNGDVALALNESRYWENPTYNMIKTGVGGTGKIGGAIAAQKMFQQYVNYNDILRGPFSKAAYDYAKGAGKWKMLDGTWAQFDDIRNATGSNVQRLKVSANSARIRGEKLGKNFSGVGKICFWVSVGFSLDNSRNAWITNDSNRNEIYWKSGVDITMGLVAFIPVVGWVISGTYFIADAFGAFGDWGQPTGISQEAYNMNIEQNWTVMYNQHIKTLKFDVDYESSSNDIHFGEHYLEERKVKIDNTSVSPRVNIEKLRF